MLGKAKLLKVFVGESERYNNKPLFQYLVHWLRERGVGGVTVSRGIEGYGQDKILRTARILELSSDLPIILEIIDTSEKIDPLITEICSIVPKGLIYSTDIIVHKNGADS